MGRVKCWTVDGLTENYEVPWDGKKPGGTMVSVTLNTDAEHWLCLTCHCRTCEHVEAAKEQRARDIILGKS